MHTLCAPYSAHTKCQPMHTPMCSLFSTHQVQAHSHIYVHPTSAPSSATTCTHQCAPFIQHSSASTCTHLGATYFSTHQVQAHGHTYVNQSFSTHQVQAHAHTYVQLTSACIMCKHMRTPMCTLMHTPMGNLVQHTSSASTCTHLCTHYFSTV